MFVDEFLSNLGARKLVNGFSHQLRSLSLFVSITMATEQLILFMERYGKKHSLTSLLLNLTEAHLKQADQLYTDTYVGPRGSSQPLL